MGDETHLAKWALGTLTLGAVLGPVSSVCAPPLCPRLRSIDPEVTPLWPKCQKSLSPPTAPFCRPCTPRPERPSGRLWVAQPGGGTWGGGPQTPAPAPLWHGPTDAQGGLEGGGGTWCQAAEAGGGGLLAPLATAPFPPPPAPRPGSEHPTAQLPAHPPRPRHQSTPGPSLALSFLPSSSLPSSRLFFSPLSLPTCHYSRNKKCGNNAGIDGGPLPAPSPRGACQHSFHPPRAGTAAKGALLINKRNQINQEHNRGICCT